MQILKKPQKVQNWLENTLFDAYYIKIFHMLVHIGSLKAPKKV